MDLIITCFVFDSCESRMKDLGISYCFFFSILKTSAQLVLISQVGVLLLIEWRFSLTKIVFAFKIGALNFYKLLYPLYFSHDMDSRNSLGILKYFPASLFYLHFDFVQLIMVCIVVFPASNEFARACIFASCFGSIFIFFQKWTFG